jgi:predicted lipid-binding transport protein (Tim44 family)
MQKNPCLFLLVLLSLVCLLGQSRTAVARGGGGCFLAGTPIETIHGQVPIEQLKAGALLQSFTDDGAVVSVAVRSIITHEASEYRVLRTERTVLQVTPEHPFSVGNGMFRTLEALRPGDAVRAFDGAGWSEQRILSIETVSAPATVYNLQTDAPHTFFAGGIAVHNKGGGGCFPAGTMVRTPKGASPIEMLAVGDHVVSVDERGRQVPAKITAVAAVVSELLELRTRHGVLVTTDEHPLETANGEFVYAGDIVAGDRLVVLRRGMLKRAAVVDSVHLDREEMVYTLSVDGPHTFIADGFVVHNKGGGGGGGGFRSGSRRSSGGSSRPLTKEEGRIVAVIVVGTVVLFGFAAYRQSRTRNLDQLYARRTIEQKSAGTAKLVRFIAQQDPAFTEGVLAETADTAFRKLQQCWQAREYGPMQPLMMPDLFADHLRQIEGMKRNHEINIIAGLRIDAVDLVNVRYPLNKNEREFTALLTATAQDYYIDDRTQEHLRGDGAPAQFQEFWTFQFADGVWLLREIEQTAESDILKDENYFEPFTDKAVDQVYGDAAGAEGPAGPWAEGKVLEKEQRIERLLAHLVLTDRLWERNRMLQTARSAFVALMGAWESGAMDAGLRGRLAPELAEHLGASLEKNRKAGVGLEFRNLAVRRAELVLVKNFSDNRNDEFVVRVRAHAQKVMKRGGTAVRQDDDVTAFEEYLTFGRMDNAWKLKEIVAPGSGRDLAAVQNVDEGSSPQMIEWFYQHKRPV